MTVWNLYCALENIIPRELSCSWDNDGIMCMPDLTKSVKKVLLTLDATYDAVDYAAYNGFDVIVTHHPLIFRPIKNLILGTKERDKEYSIPEDRDAD